MRILSDWFLNVSLMKCADAGVAAPKTKVKHDYTRFFHTIGVADTGKVQTLARLLQDFYDIANKLNDHLDPVGAALHSSVSRMVKADNPSAPPQYKWIRAVDRLGFFSDTDAHACRVVNVGLSYAYCHQALDVLRAANTVRLSQLHHVALPTGGVQQSLAVQDQVPAGV